MTQIRVLHMIGSLNIGGSQTMMMNIYRNIDKSKIQFDFVLDEPDERHFAEEIEKLGGKIYVMPKFRGSNFREVQHAWHMFFQTHKEYKILHSHVRSYASVYLPIAKKNGVKTIIHSHSISNGFGVQSIVKSILQYPLRYIADYFFSCSVEAGEWLYGKRTVKSKKHYVLKNAIDAKKYVFNPEIRKDVRKELSIETQKVYIHVGRFHPSKNHSFLLDVFKEITKYQKNSLLILVGDGELREEIEKKIRELEISSQVILLGNRDDVWRILQAADFFLFPSLWEGLGVVAIEAQASGLPCVFSENIPKEVKILEDTFFISLDTPKKWVSLATTGEFSRKDTYEEIVKAGYDIISTVKWLSTFYESKWK